MKKTMGILEREEGYAARLMDVFNSKKRLGFEAELFTSAEALLAYGSKRSLELLLIGADFMKEELKQTAEVVVLLTEEDKAQQSEYPEVYKYQSAERMIQQILSFYAQAGGKPEALCRADKCVYGIYAPQGRQCRGEFAWNLSRMLAKKQSVLFLSLSVFSMAQKRCKTEQDLADLMYYAKHGSERLACLTQEFVKEREGVSCMAFVKAVDDLVQIPCDDWLTLLNTLMAQSAYETVVIEVEECVQQFYRILDFCSEVYMPYVEERQVPERWELCEQYFKRMGADDVWSRSRRLQVNASCWRSDMDSIIGS